MTDIDTLKSIRFRQVDIESLGSKLKIAVIQLKGPQADAKRPIQRSDGSVSLEWSATSDTEQRGAKVLAILDWLGKLHHDTKIVVFPEYSFPVLINEEQLRRRANQYGFIIIGGADSIYDVAKKITFNMSPVIIPGYETTWITKRDPSQLESRYVSSPVDFEQIRFVWHDGGETFWFAVYICLDFLSHVLPETILGGPEGAGLFFVPMCSPVILDFQLFAATLFRRPKGTATILCNCAEEASGGGSGVYAPARDKEKHKPMLELPENHESIGLFEIDMRQLAPPRLSTYETRDPLSNCRVFNFLFSNNDISTLSVERHSADTKTRGVINPALFELAGKKMRVAFLEVSKYSSVKGKLAGHGFEALAVLGHCDIILTHVHQYLNDMIYDITRVANIPLRNGQRSLGYTEMSEAEDASADLSLPFFEVEKYYKVLGSKLVQKPIRQVPTPTELDAIVALGKDWYTPKIGDDIRQRCLDRGWILKKTDIKPGQIAAIMTIALDNRGSRIHNRLRDFEDRVLPKIVESKAVTSVYGGTGHRIDVDYLLRLNTDVKSLLGFINNTHRWAEDSRELITTNTFVVVDNLSELSLEKVLTIQALAADAANYAEKFFLPFLTPEDKLRFSSLPASQQLTVLESFKLIEQRSKDLKSLPEKRDSGWDLSRLRRSLASGLLNFFYPSSKSDRSEAFTELKEVHDFFLIKVEEILTNMIEAQISEDLFGDYKGSLGIQSNRRKTDLFYTDKIKIIIKAIKSGDLSDDLLGDLQDLIETIKVRNIFAHAKSSELDELGAKAYSDTILRYLKFLEKKGH